MASAVPPPVGLSSPADMVTYSPADSLISARGAASSALRSEAVHQYTEGIDLLLRLAREEPEGPRKQKLKREAELYVTKAEAIKAMLEPHHPVVPAAPTLPRAASLESGRSREGGATSGTRGGRGRGRVGRSRPRPGASDIWGSARGGRNTISEGVGRPTVASSMRGGGRGEPRASKPGGGEAKGSTPGSGAGQSRGGASASGVNPELEKKVLEEMLDSSPGITWDMVVGQEEAKQTLQETVILPILRPDLFTGLRTPSRGVLLYGPPGTGKTMLAKAVATESAYSFFSISASSLTSKWVGEGEKLVRALFSAARKHQPAVIFVDEIDSVLSARAEGEQEASRRLKTEFLVQFDGIGHGGESDGEGERLLVLAATNLPQELDEAVLRRLSRRVYVPLPDPPARRALLTKLLASGGASNLSARAMDSLVVQTEGYSGSDLKVLCHVAAMQPIRELGSRIRTVDARDVRDITLGDFEKALSKVRPSVSKKTVEKYHEWEMSMQR